MIGPQVVARLEAEGYEVERVAGDTRFETAAAFAEWVGTGSFGFNDKGVVLANGGADHGARGVDRRRLRLGVAVSPRPRPTRPATADGRGLLPAPSEQLLADRAGTIQQLHVVRSLLGGEPTVAEGVIDAARTAAAD